MNLLQSQIIAYDWLAEANDFYHRKGYTQIEVPWIVEAAASLMTAEYENRVFVINDGGHLVGSAEQGFIHQMINNSKLPYDKKFQAISPCFRRESLDETHSKWFIKLELFLRVATSDPDRIMNQFIRDAREFFKNKNINVEQIYEPKTSTFDLVMDHPHLGKLELGSYGYRNFGSNLHWVFGTGLALPRAQLAVTNI